MRSVMNRITRRMLSGGLVAGLTILAASAHAQARSGKWTLNAPEGDWWMTGRDYSLQRFSPLAQINTSNVANLKAAWTFSTGTLRGHEGNPLVVGNVMYVHTSFPNNVYALDLSKEGAPQIWKYVPSQSPDAIPIACCDLVNRGTAYHPSGKLYIELLQGDLIGDRCQDRQGAVEGEAPGSLQRGRRGERLQAGRHDDQRPDRDRRHRHRRHLGWRVRSPRPRLGVRREHRQAPVDRLQHRPGQRSPDRRRRQRELSRPTRARTSGSAPGRATSGSGAAAPPGAGTATIPS